MTVWHPWEQCCHQPFTSLAFNSTQLTPTRILRALPWQPSNGRRRPSFRDLQLHSLLQPSRAWRSCVAIGSHPRWRLFHNVKLSLPLRLTADKCGRIWIKQPTMATATAMLMATSMATATSMLMATAMTTAMTTAMSMTMSMATAMATSMATSMAMTNYNFILLHCSITIEL